MYWHQTLQYVVCVNMFVCFILICLLGLSLLIYYVVFVFVPPWVIVLDVIHVWLEKGMLRIRNNIGSPRWELVLFTCKTCFYLCTGCTSHSDSLDSWNFGFHGLCCNCRQKLTHPFNFLQCIFCKLRNNADVKTL